MRNAMTVTGLIWVTRLLDKENTWWRRSGKTPRAVVALSWYNGNLTMPWEAATSNVKAFGQEGGFGSSLCGSGSLGFVQYKKRDVTICFEPASGRVLLQTLRPSSDSPCDLGLVTWTLVTGAAAKSFRA